MVCKEDDIMPALAGFADIGDMRPAQQLVSYLANKGVSFTAKTYSLLLKGNMTSHNILISSNHKQIHYHDMFYCICYD